MRFILPLVILLGACACHARDDEIEINEIDNGESVPREVQRVRNVTLAKIYENAVQAYLEEDWDGCVAGFNDALHGYKVYKRMVIICRRKCKAETAGSSPIFAEDIEDLHFYERKVRETLCLMKCNQDYREIAGEGALKRLPHATERKFVDLAIYEYLHICYFQKERYQDAANAAFTFLSLHPNHEMTKKNLKYYLNLPNVTVNKVVNLEAAPFVQKYTRGVKAYEDEYYEEAVIEFENSLELYIESEEECRLYCEGPFDQGWYPEFTSSIANHFTFCLKCKRICSLTLNNINGNFQSDLLRSHYNYLQFAYYKLGNLKAACAAVASYLLFLPADEAMLNNKDYYSFQPKVEEQYFTPRKEALSYVKRQEYELLLLNYISVEFAAIDVRFNKFTKKKNLKEVDKKELGKDFSSRPILHPPPGHSPSIRTRLMGNLSTFRDKEEMKIREHHVLERLKVTNNARLIAEENELGGRNRYVADGFLNSTDCNLLMQLAQIAVEGDGYEENKNPHSSYERFEGVTVGRIALMVYFGLTKPELLKLFLQRTEAARNHVERYFNLDRPLYFTYTHLVCRTALLDSPANRTDLSHEIHADNCVIKNEGTSCLREDPAYTWRDYSAILYLNDDFDGGEFFFVEDGKRRRVQGIVRPRCGRMVAFSAGGENLHGVQGIRSGKRCAVALWFTQDEKYLEYERVVANIVLQRVHTLGAVQREDTQIPLQYEDTLIQCFKEDKTLRQILKEFTRKGSKHW